MPSLPTAAGPRPHHSSQASAVVSAGSNASSRPAGRPGSGLSTPRLVVEDLGP